MRPYEKMDYDDRPVKVRGCDSPGCSCSGEYRAPRNRDLSDYYWFCLDHVREYNRGWDYFAGMDPQQIETYNRSATVWERPSWPMGDWQQREQDLHDAIRREFFGDTATEMPAGPPMSQAEKDAMAVLELRPPVSFVDIKAQYRILVKKHHPDANAGSRAAEEKFKILNQAFTVLKEIYDSDES